MFDGNAKSLVVKMKGVGEDGDDGKDNQGNLQLEEVEVEDKGSSQRSTRSNEVGSQRQSTTRRYGKQQRGVYRSTRRSR